MATCALCRRVPGLLGSFLVLVAILCGCDSREVTPADSTPGTSSDGPLARVVVDSLSDVRIGPAGAGYVRAVLSFIGREDFNLALKGDELCLVLRDGSRAGHWLAGRMPAGAFMTAGSREAFTWSEELVNGEALTLAVPHPDLEHVLLYLPLERDKPKQAVFFFSRAVASDVVAVEAGEMSAPVGSEGASGVAEQDRSARGQPE
jgi:hypothetical protein